MNKFLLVLLALMIVSSVQSQPANSFTNPYNYKFYPNFVTPAYLDEIEGNILFDDAEVKEREGYLNDALTLFGKAAFEFNNAKLKGRYAVSLLRMSNLHMLLKNYKAAEDVIMNVVLKTYTKMGSKTGEMNAYMQLGKIYLNSGKLTQSMWFFTQQGIIAQQVSNNISYIESVLGLARIKVKKKEFALAVKDVNRAELLARSAKTSRFNEDIREIRKSMGKN